MRKTTVWLPERVAELRGLIEAGVSTRKAGQMMGGFSAGSIVSACNRFGIVIPSKDWPKEQEQQLKALIDQGLAQRECAKLMGLTQGAVAAKAKRMGWRFHSIQLKPKPPTPPKTAKPRRRGMSLAPMNGGGDPHREPPTPIKRDTVQCSPRHWESRVFGECAFPVSGNGADTLSCCNPTSGTYCKAHQAVMFIKPEKDAKALWRSLRWAA